MRASGILLPVSSLPGKYGIGCFSKEAYDFVDVLEKANQICSCEIKYYARRDIALKRFDDTFEGKCEEYLTYLYSLASREYGDCPEIDALVQDTLTIFIGKTS